MGAKGVVVRLFVGGLAILLASCQEAPEPVAPEAEGAPRASLAGGSQGVDPMELAQRIPGFGGVFLDGGHLTVYLTDPAEGDRARRVLAPLALRLGLSPASIRVRPGRFGYAELERVKRRVSPEALALSGAVYVDLDEARNRVVVGMESRAAVLAAERLIRRLGVPAGAVLVEVTEPIQFAATLRDKIRPVDAALQINFSQYVCTLGFVASHANGASFITNSHCTDRQGGTEGTEYYQPSSGVADSHIGIEVDDPEYFRGGECPRGKKCRYSDSSRAAQDAGVSFDLGHIARTTGANNGDLTIAGTFLINAENTSTNFLVGEVVNKIGRTTGWTQGEITNTCVDTSVLGSNIAQLCQTFVAAGVDGGDSGSPVFHWSGSGDNVTLYGILWGGSSSGTSFVFSPLGSVEKELGSLDTF